MAPKNSKDVAGIRALLTTMRTQTCAAAEGFTDATKVLAKDLVAKIDGIITELPKDDAVPADWSAESQVGTMSAVMAQAVAIASNVGLELKKILTEAPAQMAGQLDAEIAKRVASGDLLPKEKITAGEYVAKETVNQICGTAKTEGIEQGKKEVRDEVAAKETTVALIGKRKAALQTAGLPLPALDQDAVLLGTDEEFAKLQTTFESRRTALKEKGIQLAGTNPLLSKLFLPQDQYATTESIIVEALKSLTPPQLTLPADPAPGKAAKGLLIV